ncbi:MAG TPA: hypothetical protein VFI60_01490, partial [Candidatus Acidoferrum sp.]|nr:hypothetical protein [Candidatus Acidoferrum sp.]
MRRREFMGVCAGAALTAVAGEPSKAAASVIAPGAEQSEGGSFSLSVMLWTVFNDLPFPQRL